MSRQRIIATIAVVGLVVMVGSIALTKGGRNAGPKQQVEEAHAPAQEQATSEKAASISGNRAPSSVPEKSEPAPAAAPKAEPDSAKPFEFEKELRLFAELKEKVFLSDADEAERARLISDTKLLKSLEGLLKTPSKVGSETDRQQTDAVDLLVEALGSSSGHDAAVEVLSAVVQDPQIEDASMNTGTRRSLAGVKADVLYQWSARDPDRDMKRWLPGPVSEKIWQNVLDAQAQNVAESSTTIRN